MLLKRRTKWRLSHHDSHLNKNDCDTILANAERMDESSISSLTLWWFIWDEGRDGGGGKGVMIDSTNYLNSTGLRKKKEVSTAGQRLS